MMRELHRKISQVFLGACLGLLLLSVIIIGPVATCSYVWSENEKDFDTINIGDTIKVVIDKMGAPSHIETQNSSKQLSSLMESRYGAKKCSGLCSQLYSYEVRACLDLQTWFIEFDINGKVLEKYVITSP